MSDAKVFVVKNRDGSTPNLEQIAITESWAKDLVYCDIGGFVMDEEGNLALTDDTNAIAYAPQGRFSVVFSSQVENAELREKVKLLEIDISKPPAERAYCAGCNLPSENAELREDNNRWCRAFGEVDAQKEALRKKLEEAEEREAGWKRVNLEIDSENADLETELVTLRRKLAEEEEKVKRIHEVRIDPVFESGDGAIGTILGEAPKFIVEMLARIFKESGAENYVEFQLKDKDENIYTLHFQKTDRPTPHELRQKAESELASLRSALRGTVRAKTVVHFFDKWYDHYWKKCERAKDAYHLTHSRLARVMEYIASRAERKDSHD